MSFLARFFVAVAALGLVFYGNNYPIPPILYRAVGAEPPNLVDTLKRTDCDAGKPASGSSAAKPPCRVEHHHAYYRPYMLGMLHSYRKR